MSSVCGTVKFYDQERGFGFVKRDDGLKDVFLHAKELRASNLSDIGEGDRLQFDVADGQRGPRAENILLL